MEQTKKKEPIERILTSVISVDMWDSWRVRKNTGGKSTGMSDEFVFFCTGKERKRKKKKERAAKGNNCLRLESDRTKLIVLRLRQCEM